MAPSPSAPPASLDMLERLVAFDTTSHQSNLALIDFAAALLEEAGASVRRTYDDDGRKANLFATLGPADRPGVVLSGHSDVVPATGAGWTSDPFRATRRGDRVYGRGTADMKGFLAACLTLAPAIAARRLSSPIHIAISYDEEVGCIGVRRLIEDLAALPVRPRLCVVGEPTLMRVIAAHKGKKNVRCHVHGRECHSALNHRGVNAVEFAAELVAFLRHLQRRVRDQGPFDHGFDPPYTTIHTGTIAGGRTLNIVPDACDFEFEIRNLPTQDPESLMAELRAFAQTLVPEMRAVDAQAGILFDEYNFAPGLAGRDDDPAVRLACALTGRNDTGTIAYTTEAGLFQQADIPTVVCGPGDIGHAHRADEYIELEQLALCEDFLRRLIDTLAA